MRQLFALKDNSFRFAALILTLVMIFGNNSMQDYHKLVLFYLFGVTLLFLSACANTVAPSGGTRDMDPPVILRAEPENRTVNVETDEIRLWFDEFIQLRGLSQQFLSSPPFRKTPETRIRGKSLIISFEEDLKPNTTYTLFFGNAIADFTEGNPIPNFRFIFSTGPVLDSMELAGRVLNAYTLKPEKDVFVMLYDNYADSIPLQERPYYISRTDESGNFYFTNLRNIPYKIFALRDVNNNLIYDMPNEEIAFLDSLVFPVNPVKIIPEDTLKLNNNNTENGIDSETRKRQIGLNGLTTEETSSAVSDSLASEKKQQHLTLFLFNEVDSTQRLEKFEYLHPNRLQFVFRHPVKNPVIKAIPPFDSDWKIEELSRKADTLLYWLLDIDRDSLKLEISAEKMKTDTVRLSLLRLQTYRTEKLSDTSIQRLSVRTNLSRSAPMNLNEAMKLTFSEPLFTKQAERIKLLEDSIRIEPEIGFTDKVQKTVSIQHNWRDTTDYQLLIPDSAFRGIYGHYNDSLHFSFRTRMRSDYANLRINLEHEFTGGQLIIELLNDRGGMVEQKIISPEQQQVSFLFLMPGRYQIKLIHDANTNGKWGTGIYLEGKQPERVYILDKMLELRANWDLEEPFIITDK